MDFQNPVLYYCVCFAQPESSVFSSDTVTGAASGKFLNASTGFTVTGTGNNW
ncbi:hypothetical protein D3C81_2239900 [compost metagenome]